jgi:hypothetical protein
LGFRREFWRFLSVRTLGGGLSLEMDQRQFAIDTGVLRAAAQIRGMPHFGRRSFSCRHTHCSFGGGQPVLWGLVSLARASEDVIGRERAIQAAYEGMKGSIPEDTMDLLVGRPRFEDDKRCLPLQAADLLAWNVRRDYVEQLTNGTRWDSPTWTELRTDISGKALFMDEKELSDFRARKLAANLQRLLQE